ncbi:hypothetical protein F7D01_12210 [Erythrobacter sp. 3-20A1M]|uniref:hypothetical protein n=1 Tax=Erythrobacter sp. 3-20A1M TaxID=2653850 RepID=UPI001BFCB42E|nr:hypothetical protein [Erythrobacter sp. 3-20A1M]QWC57739.1 hypothetical protein F7D01_12210 [Erythrobacter sp. 3-20A1M]
MRRALLLTDESARHPFRASLPPHIRAGAEPEPPRSRWALNASDVRGFATTYFATLAAMLALIF